MKKTLSAIRFIAFLGLCTSGALAQAQQQSQLPPCASGSVWNQCFGTKNYPNGDKYVGEWVGGKANGLGTYTSKASAAMYSGQFAADTFSGDGTMTWANGAKFIGQWKNDSAVSGTITYENGKSAVGTVKAAVFYAAAQQPQAVAAPQPQSQAPQQQISTGKLPPCPTGKNLPPWHMCLGSWSDTVGNSYSGEYQGGDPHGQGTFTSASGYIWSGQFYAGNYVASQKFTVVATKSKLPACLGQDVRSWDLCFGSRTLNDGSQYVGEYSKGLASGIGIYTFSEGHQYFGQFKNGALSKGLIVWPDAIYEGEFANNVADGQGRMVYKDGTMYEGAYKNNRLHGLGSFTYATGKQEIGYFSHGDFIGTADSPQGLAFKKSLERSIQEEKIYKVAREACLKAIQDEELSLTQDKYGNRKLTKMADMGGRYSQAEIDDMANFGMLSGLGQNQKYGNNYVFWIQIVVDDFEGDRLTKRRAAKRDCILSSSGKVIGLEVSR